MISRIAMVTSLKLHLGKMFRQEARRKALRSWICGYLALTLAFGSGQERQAQLNRIVAGFPARVGVCYMDNRGEHAYVNGEQRFSLQSVMKLVVSLAILDAADQGHLSLAEPIVVRRQDLSLYVQPIAELVGPGGFSTTVADLIRRAIVDSDSAAADILMSKLGGPARVQAFLRRKGIDGIRIDRDERHLQTEIVGLHWRPEYVDPKILNAAIAAVPTAKRNAAYVAYQHDNRDTATPNGMAILLHRLASGTLLSNASTIYALQTLAQTVTFPDRLKGGAPQGWTVMHKTGTSGSWMGVTAATNDVGILQSPTGRFVAIAVFIADTAAPPEDRSRLMRAIAAAVVSP